MRRIVVSEADLMAGATLEYEGSEKRLYEALGQLVVAAGDLQDALYLLYAAVTCKKADLVVQDLGGRTLGDLWKKVQTACDGLQLGMLQAQFDNLKPHVVTAIEIRNSFIHASWVENASELDWGRTSRPKAKKKGDVLSEEWAVMETEEVRAGVGNIEAATDSLEMFSYAFAPVTGAVLP